jgi:hypothetical protein
MHSRVHHDNDNPDPTISARPTTFEQARWAVQHQIPSVTASTEIGDDKTTRTTLGRDRRPTAVMSAQMAKTLACIYSDTHRHPIALLATL